MMRRDTVDVCIAHAAVGTACCVASGIAAYIAGLPSMLRSPATLMQCTCTCALLHATVAAYGRIDRVHAVGTLHAFWGGMLAATWALVAVQKSLPTGAFIMLSAQGLQALSAAGWVLLCACAVAAGAIVSHHAHHIAANPHKHRRVKICAAVATAVLVLAMTAAPGFHMHHYMWAPAVALACQCDTGVSMACQSIALGIMNQELAFGDMNAFYDRVPVQKVG